MVNLREAVAELQELKALWKEHAFQDYYFQAQEFLRVWRGPIRDAASHAEPFHRTIRCLEGLLVIHNNVATTDEDVRVADEDLFLDAASRFTPRPEYRLTHDFQIHTLSSNIFKRRSFVALRSKKLGEAEELLEKAVNSAERALAVGENRPDAAGAAKHLQYLRFHFAVTGMRWAESRSVPDEAEERWRAACEAVDHAAVPEQLFAGRAYLFDRGDLDAYVHLVKALAAFLEGQLPTAIAEYEYWLSAVPQHRLHWRFANVRTRQAVAEILLCLASECGRCSRCSDAAAHLQVVASTWGVGAAARDIARTGLSLYQLGKRLDAPTRSQIVAGQILPLTPLDATAQESGILARDDYSGDLPFYFGALALEVKGLRHKGYSDQVLREFVWRRMTEFVGICAEYENGRTN